jgi:hypothetical protein
VSPPDASLGGENDEHGQHADGSHRASTAHGEHRQQCLHRSARVVRMPGRPADWCEKNVESGRDTASSSTTEFLLGVTGRRHCRKWQSDKREGRWIRERGGERCLSPSQNRRLRSHRPLVVLRDLANGRRKRGLVY